MVGVVEAGKWEGEGESTPWGANEGTSGRRNLRNETGDSGKAALDWWKICAERERERERERRGTLIKSVKQ